MAILQCLNWTPETGLTWAKLFAELRSSGKSMPIKDSLAAATARMHGLTVVTRNVADFSHAGAPVFNPFSA